MNRKGRQNFEESVMVNLTMNTQRPMLIQHKHQQDDFCSLRHCILASLRSLPNLTQRRKGAETRRVLLTHIFRDVVYPTDHYRTLKNRMKQRD
jgi:hypothetical protein